MKNHLHIIFIFTHKDTAEWPVYLGTVFISLSTLWLYLISDPITDLFNWSVWLLEIWVNIKYYKEHALVMAHLHIK